MKKFKKSQKIKIIKKDFVKWMNEETMKLVKDITDNEKGIKYVNTNYRGGEATTTLTTFKVRR